MNKTFQYNEVLSKTLDFFGGDLLAASTVVKKYLLRDKEGAFHEQSPVDMHRRLALEFTRVEKKMNPHVDTGAFFERAYRLIGSDCIVPQGSPMAGIGNPFILQSISNCTVVASPEDNLESIFDTGREIGQLQKRRAGVGVDLSTLRPYGSAVNNSAEISSGTPCFSDFYSFITRMIGQKGRQGALMLTLHITHPDAQPFAVLKHDETKATGANLSFRITDEFMRAVEEDKTFMQRWPVNAKIGEAKITKMIPARELWDIIVDSAWRTGDPGLLMWDTYCNGLPAHLYPGFETVSTNPCLTGDMKLLTEGGYRTLYDLWEDSGRADYDPELPIEEYGRIRIVNRKGAVESTRVYRTGLKQPVFEVTLANGQKIRATSNHEFILSDNTRVRLKDLVEGDDIPLNLVPSFGISRDPDYALLAGWVIGDGSISSKGKQQRAHVTAWNDDIEGVLPHLVTAMDLVANQYGQSSRGGYAPRESKPKGFRHRQATFESLILGRLLKEDGLTPGSKHRVPESIWRSDRETVSRFLKGLFSADGSTQAYDSNATISIRLGQTSVSLLNDVSLLLSQFGIKSKVFLRKPADKKEMNDGKGGMKLYNRQAMYELIISGREHCAVFIEEIGFLQEYKIDRAKDWLTKHSGSANSSTPVVTTVVAIEYIGEEDTYCLTEFNDHEICVNGIAIAQCSELGLSPYDSCRLITNTLFRYVRFPFTKDAYFDFTGYFEDTKFAQRLSDGLVELEIEIVERIIAAATKSEKELWQKFLWAAKQGRRTGLGTHSLADVFFGLGLRYDSDEARKVAGRIFEIHRDASYWASAEMARERGPFPAWNWDLEKNHPFIKALPPALYDMISKTGRRNISNLTNAPTGSVAIKCRTSSGIESVFRLVFDRFVKITHAGLDFPVDRVDSKGDKWTKFRVVHPTVEQYFAAQGKECPVKSGRDFSYSLEEANAMLERELPAYFVTSDKIDYMKGIDLQGTIQKYIDHGISRTINLPRGTTKEEVHRVYMHAWKSGLKGITVFVDGCRDGVFMTSDKKEDKAKRPETIVDSHAPVRPEFLKADIHHVKVKGKDWAVVVGLLNDTPYELFAGQGLVLPKTKEIASAGVRKSILGKKKGYILETCLKDESDVEGHNLQEIYDSDDQRAVTRGLCRELRHGIPVEFIVRDLTKVDGAMTDYCAVLARVLKKYVKKIELLKLKCSECGDKIEMRDGCQTCVGCGASKCG